jgi:hypothetical protein
MQNHPAGITALAAGALVIVAQKIGVELTATEAGVFVALAAAIVSKFTPRNL